MHDSITKKIAITVAIDTDAEFCQEQPLTLEAPATIAQALESYSQQYNSTIDVENCETGIFAKPADKDTLLDDGDRLEIYQPLRIDPMEARRRRAERRQQRLKKT